MRLPEWLFRWGDGEAKARRAAAEAKQRRAKRMTPIYERIAETMAAELPPHELAARMRRAFEARDR